MRLRSAVPLKNVPTAQALLAAVGATLVNSPLVPGCGLATCAHLWPFQRRINGWPVVPLSKEPTAQASVADTVRTALSAAPFPGLGLATRAQAWPSQCRIRGRRPPAARLIPGALSPTAQMSVGDCARTPFRMLSIPATFGLGTTVQVEPFQCSVSVWSLPPLSRSKPTAQASQGESTATPLRLLSSVPGLGGWGPLQARQGAAGADADTEAGAAFGRMPVTAPARISATMSARARRPAGPRRRGGLGSVIINRLPKTGHPAL